MSGGDRVPILTEDVPKAPGTVLMEEEVFATWAATALVVSVMGSQFTARPQVKDSVRIPLDVVTNILSLLILVWASLCYFGHLSLPYRAPILSFILLLLVLLILSVIVLTAAKQL
jgi:hypothetical protein